MTGAAVRTGFVWVLLSGIAACQHVPPPPSPRAATLLPEVDSKQPVDIARAQRALLSGDVGRAREAFSAALRTRPNDVAAGLGLADSYLATGEVDTAAQLFELVDRRARGDQKARVAQGLGLVALYRGDLAEARRRLTDSVNTDPTLWRAWVGLGRLHARAGERNSARVAFARAEATAQNLGTVMNDIGMSYLLERLPADASPYFERALVVDPSLAVARGNLRIARAMTRDYDSAIAGAGPTDLADALNNVGYIAVVNGDFDVADRLLRRALEVSPTYHEAAAANLNLLAQAQVSGTRPPAPQLAPVRSRQTVRSSVEPAVRSEVAALASAPPVQRSNNAELRTTDLASNIPTAPVSVAADVAMKPEPTFRWAEPEVLEAKLPKTMPSSVALAPPASEESSPEAATTQTSDAQREAPAVAAKPGIVSSGSDAFSSESSTDPAISARRAVNRHGFWWEEHDHESEPVIGSSDTEGVQEHEFRWAD